MYNAFISYSHAADSTLAPTLEKTLQKFGIPWWKKRVLNIFRDEASLSASPHLWTNISKALDESEYLIYMASPQSAKSKWVIKEIEYWLEHKTIDKLLIALTDGIIIWDNANDNFRDNTNQSIPPILEKCLTSEPFYVDFRPIKKEKEVSLKNPIFQKEVLKLAAQLHGKEPKDLASEELQAQRKWTMLRTMAFVLLAILLGFSIFKTIEANKNAIKASNNAKEAVKQKDIAVEQAKKAISSSLIASSNFYNKTNPTISFRLAEYALQYDSTNTDGYATLLRAFYSNPHYFNKELHGSVFIDEITQVVSPIHKRENDYSQMPNAKWPYGFIESKGIEIWGEFHALADVIYSPNKEFALFYYTPESDNAVYSIQVWDLQNRFNKYGRTYMNEKTNEFYDEPFYDQNISYTQIEGFDENNFSFDSKYVVVPKDNLARVIELPYGLTYDGRFTENIEFSLSSSNSQVIQTNFSKASYIINTIDLKGDTISFNPSKMPLPKVSIDKTDIYSDSNGDYIIAVQGKKATIYNMEGTKVGQGSLNEKLNGFEAATDSIPNWDKLILVKVLSSKYSKYSNLYDSEIDIQDISSDGKFKMEGSVIKDSIDNTVISLTGHSEIISSVDISYDDQMYLTATCPKIGLPETKLWDKKGNEILSLQGFGGKVGFLPGNKAFYTYLTWCCVECDSDRYVLIWPIDKELLIRWVNKNGIYKLNSMEMKLFGIDTTLLSQNQRQ